MIIDTSTMVSMTEANQNFSKVARLVDERGSAVIMKNNMPKYLVMEFGKAEEGFASDINLLELSNRLLQYNTKILEALKEAKNRGN
ncbi:MAG: type II toxin-antitoxin system Phd/YefM family antitoxin [Lachnospiraceae bacterium]|nr:type II toxin-antitoxin system Phd/YefM family antitoxin [Lachnospiraceae bacterium]